MSSPRGQRAASSPVRTTISKGFRSFAGSLLACLAIFGSATIQAQETPRVRLTVPVQETVVRLHDQWLVLSSAIAQEDRRLAENLIGDMEATAAELGMQRLPDVAIGVLVRAREAADAGNHEQALWATELAERLDPGRPEIEVARSRFARQAGDYVLAGRSLGSIVLKTLQVPILRELSLINILLWLLASLVIAGLLWVAIQFALKGQRVLGDLAVLMSRWVPRWMALGGALVVALWPLLLPNGWFWLPCYWIVLTWGYFTSLERRVAAALLLLVGVLPTVVGELDRRISVRLSNEMRAVDAIEAGRIYGLLFADFNAVLATAPESTSVRHLLADFYTRLGQDGHARPLYANLSEEERLNAPALNNLGVYHFLRDEYHRAIEFFEAAVEVAPRNLVPFYNLAQTYTALLEFKNADRYLGAARQIDSAEVSRLVGSGESVQLLYGALERTAEVQGELRRALRRDDGPGLFEHSRSLVVSLLILGIAIGVHRLRGQPRAWVAGERDTRWMNAVRLLIPGWRSGETGDGLRGYLALWLVCLALSLPFVQQIGYRMPVRLVSAPALAWGVALTSLGLIYLFRFARRSRT